MKVSDTVLRCLIPVRLDGITMNQVLDTVRDGHFINVVFQWGEMNGATRPRVFVPIDAADFLTVEDPNSPFELRCSTTIDLDAGDFTDMPDISKQTFILPP